MYPGVNLLDLVDKRIETFSPDNGAFILQMEDGKFYQIRARTRFDSAPYVEIVASKKAPEPQPLTHEQFKQEVIRTYTSVWEIVCLSKDVDIPTLMGEHMTEVCMLWPGCIRDSITVECNGGPRGLPLSMVKVSFSYPDPAGNGEILTMTFTLEG